MHIYSRLNRCFGIEAANNNSARDARFLKAKQQTAQRETWCQLRAPEACKVPQPHQRCKGDCIRWISSVCEELNSPKWAQHSMPAVCNSPGSWGLLELLSRTYSNVFSFEDPTLHVLLNSNLTIHHFWWILWAFLFFFFPFLKCQVDLLQQLLRR